MFSQNIRKPAVAGQFYTDNAQMLKHEVQKLLQQTKARKGNTLAVVSPHAGYAFSGGVAAEAINQIDPEKVYENIFVIGLSHRKQLKGASVYNAGDFGMPGFNVKVNIEIANQLINSGEYIEYDAFAHKTEHSIEVQLPFLYYHLKHDFKIVPILIGTTETEAIKQIAKALQPYFNEKNVFVFSTDFSHYPSYEDAVSVDKSTAEAFITNNSEKFLATLNKNENKKIPGLVTCACGWAGLLCLLYLTENKSSYKYEIIDYKNSGDSSYGSKDQVVGYYAISLQKIDKFELSDAEKQSLLKIARNSIENFLSEGKISDISNELITENLKKHIGAFVTLHNKGQLRGCIGRFMPNEKLIDVVQDMAVAAATEDNRFSSVTLDEMKEIEIEISVLTPLQKINSPDEIEIGRDGIYIKKGFSSGTLLPQVATDNNWNKFEFLQYCSKHKAGIGADGWKDADLFIYQAIVFDESQFKN